MEMLLPWLACGRSVDGGCRWEGANGDGGRWLVGVMEMADGSEGQAMADLPSTRKGLAGAMGGRRLVLWKTPEGAADGRWLRALVGDGRRQICWLEWWVIGWKKLGRIAVGWMKAGASWAWAMEPGRWIYHGRRDLAMVAWSDWIGRMMVLAGRWLVVVGWCVGLSDDGTLVRGLKKKMGCCHSSDGEMVVGRSWGSSDQRDLVVAVVSWGPDHRIGGWPEMRRTAMAAIPNEDDGAPNPVLRRCTQICVPANVDFAF
ncbi:hypothetical protein ACLOJK_029014 [Asimina triloba]